MDENSKLTGFKHNPIDNGFMQETNMSLLRFFSRLRERYMALLGASLAGMFIGVMLIVLVFITFVVQHGGYTSAGGILIIIGVIQFTVLLQIADPSTRRLGILISQDIHNLDRTVKKQKDKANQFEHQEIMPHPDNNKAVLFPSGQSGFLFSVVGNVNSNSYPAVKSAAVSAYEGLMDGLSDKVVLYTITSSGRLKFNTQLKMIDQLIDYAKMNNLKGREAYARAQRQRLNELYRQGQIISEQFMLVQAPDLTTAREATEGLKNALSKGIALRYSLVPGELAAKKLERCIGVDEITNIKKTS